MSTTLATVIITSLSFLVRSYQLEYPRAVVFDELHYIKFISLYAKRIFFFDPQPPFGKQLMTLFAYLVGFKGDLSYSQIGEPYKNDVAISSLRLLPCLLGSLLPPLAFHISKELGCRTHIACLVGALMTIENSLIISSRFLLLDSILLILSVASIYCYLRFSKEYSTYWLCFASISATLASCTKYSGLYTYVLLVALVVRLWWKLIEHDSCDLKLWARKAAIFGSCLIGLPACVYILTYYIHLTWLIRAGPHDSIMTSAFQASLENGLASITRGQPLEIVHGSQITLRHTHGRSCWLHSHEHLYPIKYSDGRGSSHQQQVTCYSFKDVNNWWIVKRPHLDELVVHEALDKIKHGDLVELVHGLTGRPLNSHDVASAMSPYSQEVSCYVDHNISMAAQSVWQVRLQNPQDTNGYWHTINSLVQLVHYNSSLALRFSGRQLPDWGFHQHEVVADKELRNDDTIWNVEEHRFTKSDDQRERQVQLGREEFVPLEPTSLTFFEKFYELHYKLLNYQQESIKDHIYATESPIDWILMSRGTAYWVDNYATEGNAQIFLICNTSTSLNANLHMLLFAFIFITHLIGSHRKLLNDEKTCSQIQHQVSLLFGGFCINFFPYFLYESPLFLQYYLSAYIYQILSIGMLLEYVHRSFPTRPYICAAIVAYNLAKSVDTFIKLSPLTYGKSLSAQEVDELRWKETWQLITLNA